ncbi:MAG: hypothetical protein ABIR96_10480, partial [Bdellovibrionota bacterium]
MRRLQCFFIVAASLPLAAAAQNLENTGKTPFKIALSAEFGLSTHVPDLRYKRDVYEDLFGERKPVPAQRYSFLAQDFDLDFLIQNENGYSSAFSVMLGFRNAMGGNDDSPKGSEFSGFRLMHRQSFGDGRFLSSLGYGLLRSDFLRLTARHHEYRIRLDYVPNPESLDPLKMPFFVRLGPEAIFAVPTGPDAKDRYGFQWAFHTLFRYQGSIASDMPASFGLETVFSRIASFKIDNKLEGGAGLFTLSPVVELMFVKNLWIALRVNMPVLRPVDREAAFPDPQIPGLYGSSVQFTLRTATF